MSKFIPRTEAPREDNHYYFRDNVYHQNGYGMPNCTAYAWGRFYEITGEYPRLSRRDAERWWGYVEDGYERGQTPRLGAIACWSKGSTETDDDGSGHVAVVEAINTDNSILTSNSAWQSTFFYTQNLPYPYRLGSYTFQGFIYLPTDFDSGGVPLWLLFKF